MDVPRADDPGATAALAVLSAPTRAWFAATFPGPTAAQRQAWPAIAGGEHLLLLAPTGSGKTLAAFLAVLDRLMFAPAPPPAAGASAPRLPGRGTRVVYVSPVKALAIDVERNLMTPLAGLRAAAAAAGVAAAPIDVAVRTGDTSARDRRRIHRGGADLLITTPESLYLMLTSGARDALRTVDTVIVDEIHALVPSERGAHLALSLERLAHLTGRPIQRIGLSATQRPLDEVARFLGGDRPVRIADASGRKLLDLRLELPFAPGAAVPPAASAASAAPAAPLETEADPRAPSNWDLIYPRLLELVRAHRSTLVFVNSRRLAERMAQALNELAGETLVYAHHGSVAREQRAFIEDQLKAGALRGLVATSTLELGIDMGAIDLVVQVEAPPSVASGLQRVGRAGHQVGAVSTGLIIPKHRGDLLACAALIEAMQAGAIEAIRYLRNPLDVLAQQLVAMVAVEDWPLEALYQRVRKAAPYAELPRPAFDGVLDMLAGGYALDELADVRPRLIVDRARGLVRARDGARRIAIANAGTIPDRGTFGVFLSDPSAAGARGRGRSSGGRIGELDEEMVFESAVGERFLLGASSWRIDEIGHDRVLVSPAPGEGGKMPFWRGESAMRPYPFGQRVGALARRLGELPAAAAHHLLVSDLGLDPPAAEVLLGYLADQRAATAVPTDTTIVVEVVADALGERRLCLLSPLGAQVLAPWALLAQHEAERVLGVDIEVVSHNDGFVLRLPEGAAIPADVAPAWLLPDPAQAEAALTALLAGSPLFAGRFREAAGRALLLPRRLPGQRAPLWHTRRRAHDLLRAAQRVRDFPILLEAYRKVLVDVFDLPALVATLAGVAAGTIGVDYRFVTRPSPIAAGVMFGYVASFMYEGDVPALERRAAALAIDPARLRELVGQVSLRELIDPAVLAALEDELAGVGGRARALASADDVHDLLRRRGDLDVAWLHAQLGAPADAPPPPALADLLAAGRVVRVEVAGAPRYLPVEYGARYRAALGLDVAAGPSDHLGDDAAAALRELVRCFARGRGPFTAAEVQARYPVPALTAADVAAALAELVGADELVVGEFRPDRGGAPGPAPPLEHVHPDVLRTLRARSLARLRAELAPASPEALVRFAHAWHGVVHRRRGLDAVLDAVERLQGLPVLVSQLERELLPARVASYQPHDLDTLAAAGEVVWVGVGASGDRDGRIALHLADQLGPLHDRERARAGLAQLDAGERALLDLLSRRGASFFAELRAELAVFPGELVRALWSLAWRGLVSNDSFHPLRALLAGPAPAAAAASGRRGGRRPQLGADGLGFRSRRAVPVAADGRWSVLAPVAALIAAPTGPAPALAPPGPSLDHQTRRMTALAEQWLTRHGVVSRDSAELEELPGGFAALYPVLRALEDAGRIRRGHFVAGIGALQFARPQALELLRAQGTAAAASAPVLTALAATDPANPYGAVLPWPAPSAGAGSKGETTPRRAAGATVLTWGGACLAWIGRGLASVLVWLPADPDVAAPARAALVGELARRGHDLRQQGAACAITSLDGQPAPAHPLAAALIGAGFVAGAGQLVFARRPAPLVEPPHPS
jgi:ATP-dependent Lhr-like helicase